MVKRITFGLILGMVMTVIFVQYDPWVHAQVGSLFTYSLSKSLDCRVRGTVRSVNFISPEIVFDDFSMAQQCDGDSEWHWNAKIYRTGFSWIDLIISGSIRLWAVVHDVAVTSKVINNQLAIQQHVENLLAPADSPIPIVLHDGYVHNGSLKLEHDEGYALFHWNTMSHRVGDHTRSHITITDGVITRDDIRMLENASGHIVLDAYNDNNLVMQINCQGDLGKLSDYPTVTFKGSWNKDSGRFALESLDKSLIIDPIILSEKQGKSWFDLQGTLPAAYAFFLATKNRAMMSGECRLSMKGTLDAPSFFEGQIIGENIAHPLIAKQIMCSSSFYNRDVRWFGSIDIRLPERMILQGSFKWDQKEQLGDMAITNITNLSVPSYPYWKVPQQKFTFNLDVDKEMVAARIGCDVHNELHNTILPIESRMETQRSSGSFTMRGKAHDFALDCSGSFAQYPYIDQLCYYRDKTNPYINLAHNNDETRYEGMIQIPALRALVYHMFAYDVQGEGVLEFRSKVQDGMYTQFHLKNGTIRLPGTFNFINGIDGLVGMDSNNHFTLEDISCQLHTGSLSLKRGTVWLNNAGELAFCHVPLVFDHCLLNLKRDLFAIVSGAVLFAKQPQKTPLLKGNLFLDRSQLKENIFSELFQKNLFQITDTIKTTQGVALACDLRVITKDPIRIETGFLNAQAQVDLSIQKHLSEPEITGSISLLSGSLGFPYKPLNISRGKLVFVKNQPLNPYVELLAKNNVRQHNIVLQVSGSLQDHFVLLESTPPLTEEQIIGLLLAGSHEESLSAVIPTLLVQNVTNVIFSADQSGVFDRYVKPWLKQINVHFVPKFSEESGRGGLRGALEIDVNERWRALIEKNFSLTEDTRFELEYMISDDVRLRLIRDERCDIGGEVEMKWKF